MANNRLFLLHKPTGYGIMIGKHLSNHWYYPYDKSMTDSINYFYNLIKYNEDDDDLILIYENTSKYIYQYCIEAEKKIHQFKLKG